MAHEEYTGKSGGTTITFGGAGIPTGWRKITITETGGPAPEQLDKTHAGDSTYSYMADPLGSKGAKSCTVQVEGFLSVTDYAENGISKSAMDATGEVIVIKKTAEDTWTLAGMIFRSFNTSAPFAGVVPYAATFAHDSSAGAWT